MRVANLDRYCCTVMEEHRDKIRTKMAMGRWTGLEAHFIMPRDGCFVRMIRHERVACPWGSPCTASHCRTVVSRDILGRRDKLP